MYVQTNSWFRKAGLSVSLSEDYEFFLANTVDPILTNGSKGLIWE